MVLLLNTEFVFPSEKTTKIAISGWIDQNLISTSFVEELLQDPKNQRYCTYVKDHVVDIQFHRRRDYFNGVECLVCDFLLTNTLMREHTMLKEARGPWIILFINSSRVVYFPVIYLF